MLFVGCQTTEKTLQKDSGNLAKTKITEDKYITLTNTYVADQAGENNEMMVMDVIKYDLSNGTISKIASLPSTSQYPLTMYDAKEEKVYYFRLGNRYYINYPKTMEHLYANPVNDILWNKPKNKA